MGNVNSTLTMSLIDNVSKPAKTVAQALEQAEKAARDVAKGMAGTGATDKFVRSLSGLKLAGKDIETVAKAWKDYAKSANLAADASLWTKQQRAGVSAWERQTVSALKNVQSQQAAFVRSINSAAGGGGGKGGRVKGFMSEQARDFASGMMMGSIPMMAGMKAYEGGRELIKEGMAYQHEKIALQNAGRTISELNEMEEAAKRAAKAVPTSSVKENLAILNETTGAFGSTEHALENLEFMARTASVLKAAVGDKISDNPGELGNKFARFMEMRGVAQNVNRVHEEGDALTRAMIFSRGNFNPAEMVNFAQQAKSSLQNYNKEFLTEKLPSVITEFGGERAGTMANSFMNTLMGRVRDKNQTAAWIKAGLIDPNMVIGGKGAPISWKGGAVKGTDLAMSDPTEWARQYLIPSLQKQGINTEDNVAVTKALATMFRNSTANQFANVITQANSRNRILKDQQLMRQAGTPEEVLKRNLEGDPTVAAASVKAAFENLSAAVMKSAPIASGLNALAASLNGLGSVSERAGRFWDQLNAGKKPWQAWEASGATSSPSFNEAFAKYRAPDLRPSFSKFGDEAFRVGSKKAMASPQYAGASPVGVVGGISPSATPAFARMQGAGPSVNTSGIDAAKAKISDAVSSLDQLNRSVTVNVDASPLDAVPGKANAASGALQGVSAPVSVHVDSSAIDAAISKANQLRAILGGIGGAAAGAAAAVSGAAASASAAASQIKSASAVARSNYVSGGVQGGN